MYMFLYFQYIIHLEIIFLTKSLDILLKCFQRNDYIFTKQLKPDDDLTDVVAMVFMLGCFVFVTCISDSYSTNYFCAYIAIATGYTLEEISKHWAYLEETLVPTLRECVCVCVCMYVCVCLCLCCVCYINYICVHVVHVHTCMRCIHVRTSHMQLSHAIVCMLLREIKAFVYLYCYVLPHQPVMT